MSPTFLIARSVLIEAVRKKEIYAIVLVSTIIIGALMMVDFFQLEGLTKFYREIALTIMSTATAITVIVLAARQLPREFESRTIYPLLAKPISRMTFLNGKLLGVMLAATFCFAIFMCIYLLGSLYLRTPIPTVLFLQYLYLQLLKMLLLAAISFWLSMILTLDAAITIGVLFYLTSTIVSNSILLIYEFADSFGRVMITIINYILPQLTLLDLSERTVHAADNLWGPLAAIDLFYLSLYALSYTAIFYTLAFIIFRRRPL